MDRFHFFIFLLFFPTPSLTAFNPESPVPLVVVPPAIFWHTENAITVTPSDWSMDAPEVTLSVGTQAQPGLEEDILFREAKTAENGKALNFFFNTSHRPEAPEYRVVIDVTGHRRYFTTLFGAPNLKSVSIQTDKGFYRPGEDIQIRILPITDRGELFTFPLKLSLVNAQGFKVLSETVLARKEFIRHTFLIPDFAPAGTWQVTVAPVHTNLTWQSFQTRIRVQDYSLPKFFVSMIVEDSSENVNLVRVRLHARYPHGTAVSGTVLLQCHENSTDNNGKLENGMFDATIDAGLACSQNDSVIKMKAQVTDLHGDIVLAVREFRLRGANFQIIPSRPIFDNSTKSIQLYFKPLLTGPGTVVNVRYLCISTDPKMNGENNSFSTSVGQVVDFEISGNCLVYIFSANRQISKNGTSDDIYLFVPSISSDKLALSLINTPKKTVYNVGDRFETTVQEKSNFVVVCNEIEIVRVGSAAENNVISFPVAMNMQGFCIVYVYGLQKNKRDFQYDMWMFFVEKTHCPSAYSLSADKKHLIPPHNLTLTIRAKPTSLAVIKAIDERLNHIVDYLEAPRPQLYWNLKIFVVPTAESSAPKLVNFIDSPTVYKNIQDQCRKAGKNTPINPVYSTGKFNEVSDLSEFCMEQFTKAFDRVDMAALPSSKKPIKDEAARMEKVASARALVLSATHNLMMHNPDRFDDAVGKTVEIPEVDENFEDEVFLRTFFPEVWYFNDLRFRTRSELKLNLSSPHAISRWTFSSVFWTPGSKTTCSAPAVSVHTRRHVFMEIFLPSHVFENETIQARVVVNADNFGEEKRLSICFTGLSPAVCADMGKDGEMAQTEYNRVVLSKMEKRTEKIVFLKFLKAGIQTISFELRNETNVIGGSTHHCANKDAHIFDKVAKTVKVEKRLDQKEHFRQINIYPQRKVFKSSAADQISEKLNIIRFDQKLLDDDQVETFVSIEPDVEIISTFAEFSVYQPSFPLGHVSNEILTSRKRRTVDKIFSTILMEYSFATYNQKQSRLNGNLRDGTLMNDQSMSELQLLRLQLLKFSNCSNNGKACAFGEYGPPVGDVKPSLLYTATVASLMCEENVEDQAVCGALTYLVNQVEIGLKNLELDFHGQISFGTKDEEVYFMIAVLKQAFNDCGMKTCMQNMKHGPKNLSGEIYHFNTSNNHDIRVEAALASVAPKIMAGNLRQRIRDKANVESLPYWKVPNSNVNSIEDEELVESAELLANALALLAFVNQSTQVYDHYRAQFDLARLSDWISEEQKHERRFMTALDTFYSWRALYRYQERRLGPMLSNNVQVQLSGMNIPTKEYSARDMPFSVQIPSTARNFTITTTGDGRIVAGIRVLASPRKRSKRDDDSSPNILITAKQEKVYFTDHNVTQRICIKTKSKMIKTLQVDHHFYTGFTADFTKFSIMGSHAKLIGMKTVTEHGLHFTLAGLTPDHPTCYMLIIEEPSSSYTPEFLAPVTIEARFNQLHSQLIVDAKDIKVLLALRRKRSDARNSAELVDTICLEHGTCTCAELTCSATCQQCSALKSEDWRILRDEIRSDIQRPGRFGIVAEFVESSTEIRGNEEYQRLLMSVIKSRDKRLIFGCVPDMDRFVLWVRNCNARGCTDLVENGIYILVGNDNGFFQDTTSIADSSANSTQMLLQHYLLTDNDLLNGGPIDDNDETSCSQLIEKFHFYKYPNTCKSGH